MPPVLFHQPRLAMTYDAPGILGTGRTA
jgi:hypothetical protein